MVRIKTPKEAAPATTMEPGANGPEMSEAPAFPTAQTGGLTWSAPIGWKELPASGMRAGTLVPPTGDGTELSIFALPGDAGGELPNVNRWRGQIGLPPLDEAALARTRLTLSSPAGQVSLYDFTSNGAKRTRLAAALVQIRGASWFFKLTGAEESVGKSLPAFKKMLEGMTSHAD